jgi:hypothetical protein
VWLSEKKSYKFPKFKIRIIRVKSNQIKINSLDFLILRTYKISVYDMHLEENGDNIAQ